MLFCLAIPKQNEPIVEEGYSGSGFGDGCRWWLELREIEGKVIVGCSSGGVRQWW